MRKIFLFAAWLMAACLLAGCAARPPGEEGFAYPLDRDALSQVLAGYDWDWHIAEEQPRRDGQRQPPPDYDAPVLTGIWLIADHSGNQGFINMHAYKDETLPGGGYARHLSFHFGPASAVGGNDDEPQFWLLAGRLMEDAQTIAQLSQEIKQTIAGADLTGVEKFICYGRAQDIYCQSVYAWDEGAQLHLLYSVDFWRTDDYPDRRMHDFASMFGFYDWPKAVSGVREAAAAGAEQERFLCVGRLGEITRGGQGVFYSEALQCHIVGQSWQAVLRDGSGEIDVLVLPALFDQQQLEEELLHMVRYQAADGQYLVEMSATPAARYLL